MPNIAKVLKDEIARIAKHESKIAVSKPLKTGIANKRYLVDLKRRLAQIEKSLNGIQKAMETCSSSQAQAPVEPEGKKEWLSGRGIRALRRKMRVSQVQFAKLIGMNPIAVVRWEKQRGKLVFKKTDTLGKILDLRGIGVREAQERLKGMGKKGKGLGLNQRS
jgi:DNA-binding transcriptional regulator YiaG